VIMQWDKQDPMRNTVHNSKSHEDCDQRYSSLLLLNCNSGFASSIQRGTSLYGASKSPERPQKGTVEGQQVSLAASHSKCGSWGQPSYTCGAARDSDDPAAVPALTAAVAMWRADSLHCSSCSPIQAPALQLLLLRFAQN